MRGSHAASAIVAASLAVTSAISAAKALSFPLQPLTKAQVIAAGAAGTGCSWRLEGGRRPLFAAADDRAAIRLAGRVVALRPAASAHELFPFTFDRWSGEGVLVAVRPSRRGMGRSGETTVRQAALAVVLVGSVAVERRGRLDCGS